MLTLYYKQFQDIMQSVKGRKKTLLLSNLMLQMESYYELSMIKERFEHETDPAVKTLYLSIADARKL